MSATGSRAPDVATRQRRSGAPRIVFLRPVPGDTPVHRLWAGTKLLAVAALSFTLSFQPSWGALAVVAAAVVGMAALARIPLGAWPRFGRWFWAIVGVGALLTLSAGGTPTIAFAGVHVGLGAIDAYARFTAFSFVLLGASLLVGWTTPAADLAPAVATLGAPLRWVRVPVDEWAVTVALCVRSLPLLVDEIRTLIAARRLRPPFRAREGRTTGRWLDEPVDLLTAAIVVALRRAGEMAEAITARGGTATLAAPRGRPSGRDVLALVIIAVVCAVAWSLPAG
ncbi:MAG: energy-coupling factor transporter transmembrane component T family protein [Acidimicrobiales bacterium]